MSDPILEMVTEKYLLRFRHRMECTAAGKQNLRRNYLIIQQGDIKRLVSFTSENFDDPIKTIIPWSTTHFTETIIRKTKDAFKNNVLGVPDAWGNVRRRYGIVCRSGNLLQAKQQLLTILQETKHELEESLPFAMNPVVYNFFY